MYAYFHAPTRTLTHAFISCITHNRSLFCFSRTRLCVGAFAYDFRFLSTLDTASAAIPSTLDQMAPHILAAAERHAAAAAVAQRAAAECTPEKRVDAQATTKSFGSGSSTRRR